jgi:hypothetical protein
MKKIFILVLLVVSLNCFAQVDSAHTTITVSVQARDLAYIANFTSIDPIFEDLDSTMKTKFRVTSPPSGTTTVSIPGIQVRAWLTIFIRLLNDPIAVNANVLSRIQTVLNGSANGWIVFRISRETNNMVNQMQAAVQAGAARLQKQKDTQIIN